MLQNSRKHWSKVEHIGMKDLIEGLDSIFFINHKVAWKKFSSTLFSINQLIIVY